jgi:hypothetical protein
LKKNLLTISAGITIITLVSSIISLSSFYPLTSIFAQTTPAVHIEQECLKGSIYRYQVTISGFNYQPGDFIGFLIDGNLISYGNIIGIASGGIGYSFGGGEHQIIAFKDSNGNQQVDPGETSASLNFESINCNEGCPTVNVQHWDKVAFKIIRQNLASQLNLPYNSELDIRILEKPDGLTDIKKEVLDHLGVSETQRSAIQILDISYSIVCAYFQPIPGDDSNGDAEFTSSGLMDITPINMTTPSNMTTTKN